MNDLVKQVQEACAAVCESTKNIPPPYVVWEFNSAFEKGLEMASSLNSHAIRALDLSHLTGWQDISTAPKDGIELLLWNGERRVTGKYVVSKNAYGLGHDSEHWELLDGADSCGDPSIFPEPIMWQPLPPAPKEK